VSRIILVTGGARSGKSRFAENLARSFGSPLGYLATGESRDSEMDERIIRHRDRRGPEWSTIEEPLRLTETLAAHDGCFRAVLVDCITLWLSNLLLAHDVPERVMTEVREFTDTASKFATPLILVTNEVGMGIVPENRLARMFRDLAGEANELLAAVADEVHVVFSGIPLKLKG
jgi:adenosylcobinamide kinase/adenosylcobinamide-phosphate guanylyltransferase